LLEAVNLGSIDISADVADTVPIFAQAAGAQLTYLALETPSPEAQAIVVAKNSPITKLSDLKGKRIAVTKGAGVHLLIARALQKANLTIKDVDIAYLQPPDARAAFEGGSVDAWALWDPFFAELQKASDVRIIADGRGLTPYQRVYLAANGYATKRPDVLKAFYNDIAQTGLWAKHNPRAAAELIAPIVGTDAATLERVINRRSLDVRPVKSDDFDEQQKIADTFHSLGVIPVPVIARNAAVWAPK
jgi:sulfonate transport system substrate-binding protein